jgi:hypothetical protein
VRQEKGKIIVFVVILIAALLLAYTWYTSGTSGIWSVIKRFLIYAIIAIVIGLIIFVVMKILQKEPIDLVANDKKDIIDAGMLSKPPMVHDLYATGDKEHGEFRLGRIVGYCQIQNYKDLDLLAGMSQMQLGEMKKRGEIPSEKILVEDCFIFKRFPFPFSIFEEPKVLRCFEDEHSQIIGDVKIYCVSIIRKYTYYFPNRAFLDISRIDISIIREAWRGQIHQFLRDMVSINTRAVGLDAEFKKELDRRKMLKIPSPMGEPAEREGRT